jgi:ribonuclease HII
MKKVLGIDEAGRGPVIGPLVLAGVMLDEKDLDNLKKLDVRDSKLMTPRSRELVFDKIKKEVKAFKILIVEPKEVDEALESDSLNLNWLEAKKTAEIINDLKPDRAAIDSPSPNLNAYRNYLTNLLEDKSVELIIGHKMESKYIEVAAASVLAKVTRDKKIEEIKELVGNHMGSGYMSDPRTKEFFEENFERYPEIFRKSWMPFKKAVDNKENRRLDEF